MTSPAQTTRSPKGFTLSPADEPILLALARYRYLVQKQVQRLLYAGGSRSYPSLRLKRLVEAGYVGCVYPPRPTRAGGTAGVYHLATKGRNHVSRLGVTIPERYRPEEEAARSYEHYAHALAIVDACIAVDLLCRQVPALAVEELLPDRVLKHRPIIVAIPVADPLTGELTTRPRKLIPDAYLLLRYDDGTRQRTFPILLELDRATQQQRAWREKVRAYLAALAGPYQAAFGQDALTIAIVAVAGDRRAAELLTWTEAELAAAGRTEDAGVFLVTGDDPAAAEPAALLLAPRWRSPFERRPLPLLELPTDS